MNLLRHKRLKAVDNKGISYSVVKVVPFWLFFPHRYFIWIKSVFLDIYVAKIPPFCQAQVLLQTCYTYMNQFQLHCRVHEPLIFEKCAIIDSLVISFAKLSNVPVVPEVVSSHKSRNLANVNTQPLFLFFYNKSKIRFSLCLIHFIHEYVWHWSEVWNTSWKALPT